MFYHFSNDRSGGVAVVTAIVLPLLLAVVGLSFDFGRAQSTKTHLQGVADAAALAAATALSVSEAEMRKVGKAYVTANADIPHGATMAAPSIMKRGSGTVVNLNAQVPTTFSLIMGFTELDVSVTAHALVSGTGREEIALLLDASDSMNRDGKFEQMKVAATSLARQINPMRSGSNYRVVSLVPYAESVNLGMTYQHWLGAGSTNYPNSNFVGCFRPESDASIVSDSIPTPGPGDFEAMLPLGTEITCPEDESRVRFAMSNENDLVNAINELRTTSGTGVDLALSWAWRMLSPEWEGMFDGPSQFPKSYDDESSKTIILLTDGRAWRDDANGDGNKNSVEDRASIPLERFKKVCAAIKQQGKIRVYTVGFELDSSSAEMVAALQDCATSDGGYYAATTSNVSGVLAGLATTGASVPYLTK